MDNTKNTNTELEYSKYEKEYSESKFWDKIKNAAKIAGEGITYNALLLYYVMMDPSVPLKDKSMIVGALGYFILPIDLIPDFIPVAGYTDDAAALLSVIKFVSNHITPEIKEKAKTKLNEWF